MRQVARRVEVLSGMARGAKCESSQRDNEAADFETASERKF